MIFMGSYWIFSLCFIALTPSPLSLLFFKKRQEKKAMSHNKVHLLANSSLTLSDVKLWGYDASILSLAKAIINFCVR